MVTVDALRHKLIELGLTEEEAAEIKGKKNVQDKIEELKVNQESTELFDEAVVDEDENIELESTEEKTEEDNVPAMTDPEWPAYVLSHLEENEKIKGHPKADSLRRLTELLMGPVINIETQVPQTPTLENGGRATVIVNIVVDTLNGAMGASGAADVFPGNTEQLFAKFPVATAETRAEGRAYRKMLRLINVVTAEELVDENEIYDPHDSITDGQITQITTMCSPAKLDINVEALLDQYDVKPENLDKVSKSKGLKICKIINSYQETGVPEELVGYKADWR